jgi:hypothetical protein
LTGTDIQQGDLIMKANHLLLSAVSLLLFGPPATYAQTAPDPSGHWKGSLEIPGQSLPVEFDLAKDPTGHFVGTFTGSDVKNLPLTKIAVSGRSVALQATSEQPFNGELSADGRTIAGTVILSGYSLPLELTRTGDARVEPPPTSAPIGSELEGTWEGTLNATRGPLRIVLTMTNRPDGRATGNIVSVDEGGLMIPVVITQNGRNVSYTATALPSSWAGALSADGNELAGTFTQGSFGLPLNFRRAAAERGK